MLYNANQFIAHGSLTNSKRPSVFVEGIYPTHVESGNKCYLMAEKKRYLDFICALGSNYFGYANPEIQQAIVDQLKKGTLYSLGSNLEIEVAELFCNYFKLEKLRFLKTGTEACMAAIKIARSYTNKKYIVSEGYHGWSDIFVSLTPPANGVVGNFAIIDFPTYQLNKEKIKDNIAAFIIEPVITEYIERKDWLFKLHEEAEKIESLVIYDETITGYRFPKGSVSSYFDTFPDLQIFGKAIGAGMPLAIIGGKKNVMESEYFVSSTFAGDTIALMAAKQGLKLINSSHNPQTLWDQGKKFISEINQITGEIVQFEGYPTRGILTGDDLNKALFMQECCKAGILIGPSWFLNFDMIIEFDNIKSIFMSVINKIKNKEVRLEGKMPIKPYAQQMRDKNESLFRKDN